MASNIDTLRKILVTGLGAAFMTEDSLGKALGDMKLPRDAKNYLKDQARKKKEDLQNIVSSEIKRFLEKVNIHEELHKALVGLELEVKATVKVSKAGAKVKVAKQRVGKKS